VQDDINDLVFDALKKTSTLTWEKSAWILYTAMKGIMEWKLKTNASFFSKLFWF
jgi:hypothetical protein